MSNHSSVTQRTASGALVEHAGQKTVEHENSDGGLVNIDFDVADVARPLVLVSCRDVELLWSWSNMEAS